MKKGFTLIEIILVVSAMVILITSLSGIFFGVFGSKNKNEAIDKITQNGNFILDEIKKNVINADGSGENGVDFSCSINDFGTSITYKNVKDGESTTISCLSDPNGGYRIASISGKLGVGTTMILFQKNNDLQLNNCNNFVTCSTLPSLQLSDVKFNFILNAGTEGLSSGTSKAFFIDVTLRN